MANTPKDLQDWFEARKRHHLSHAHVQMARELGMNPRKLGKLANHRQEPWKLPLPRFIEELYEERFGRPRPQVARTLEEHVQHLARQKAEKKARKEARRQASATGPAPTPAPDLLEGPPPPSSPEPGGEP